MKIFVFRPPKAFRGLFRAFLGRKNSGKLILFEEDEQFVVDVDEIVFRQLVCKAGAEHLGAVETEDGVNYLR